MSLCWGATQRPLRALTLQTHRGLKHFLPLGPLKRTPLSKDSFNNGARSAHFLRAGVEFQQRKGCECGLVVAAFGFRTDTWGHKTDRGRNTPVGWYCVCSPLLPPFLPVLRLPTSPSVHVTAATTVGGRGWVTSLFQDDNVFPKNRSSRDVWRKKSEVPDKIAIARGVKWRLIRPPQSRREEKSLGRKSRQNRSTVPAPLL